MRSRFIPVLILSSISITAISAPMPTYLNSNDVENALPQPNVPADSYRPVVPQVNIAAPNPQQLPLASLVYLSGVQIEGGTVYEFAEIAELFTHLLNRTVTLKDILAVTERITQRYQNDGYALSYAYLPQQNILSGEITVVLVEGYVSQHEMQGDIGPVMDRIKAMVQPILRERPLTKATFDRYTSLMSQIPGVSLVANVAPPKTTDGAVTLVTEARRRAFDGTASIQKDKGDDLQVVASAISNSQTAVGEQVAVTTLLPPGKDHERYLRLDYSQYVSNNGTRLQTYVSGYKSEPTNSLIRIQSNAAFDYSSRKNNRASIGVSHPFQISSQQIVTGVARVYGVDDERKYDLLATTPQPRVIKDALKQSSKVRALALEGDWRQAQQKQMRVLSAGVYQGMNTLGAKSELELVGTKIKDRTDLDFTRVRLSGLQSNNYADALQGVASGAVYWSRDTLPESEQVIFGDRNFARGYPSDQAYGDKGWGAGYELGYSIKLDEKWLRLVQPYAALDAARSWYNLSESGSASDLSSAALGVRLADKKFYNLGLEVARPMGDKAIDSRDRSVRYGVTLSYSL
ncbi:MAG: ShlB/FhaC/HecB family hemolysin secretion/activation protein [Gammaproteobacteria bacterium]|nr:ShlB/FhaC/HecB family hemolysin secretion/activation protein [Gammaproteobacteria bacterium]